MRHHSYEQNYNDFNFELSLPLKTIMNQQPNVLKVKTIDLVEKINNRINIIEYEEKLTQRISNSSDKVFKMVKDYYFPKKIILIVFAVFVSLAFLIIAFTTNNLQVFFNVEYLNLIISFTWLVILTFMTLLFLDIIKTEFYIKRILNELENTALQFKIFSEFACEMDRRGIFRKEVLELFVKQYVFNHYSDLRNIKKPYYYINDMVPKITDMIIFRAITKGFIEEENESWYDEYRFSPNKDF